MQSMEYLVETPDENIPHLNMRVFMSTDPLDAN
jgi:hypothetical protein